MDEPTSGLDSSSVPTHPPTLRGQGVECRVCGPLPSERGNLKRCQGLSPRIQVRNVTLTVLYVPYSLDCGRAAQLPLLNDSDPAFQVMVPETLEVVPSSLESDSLNSASAGSRTTHAKTSLSSHYPPPLLSLARELTPSFSICCFLPACLPLSPFLPPSLSSSFALSLSSRT
jgi:hypothetical protein